MRNECRLIAAMVIGLFLLSGTTRAEAVCGKERHFKPVRCICGKVFYPLLSPVSGALVRVVQNGKEVATVKTAEDGRFQFPELKSGRYELAALFDGFRPFQSPIILKNASKQCRREVVVVLVLFYPDNCGSYVLKR
jgi:Carboxypeptidase regulatory-like domain